jgi:hypothetical protein
VTAEAEHCCCRRDDRPTPATSFTASSAARLNVHLANLVAPIADCGLCMERSRDGQSFTPYQDMPDAGESSITGGK